MPIPTEILPPNQAHVPSGNAAIAFSAAICSGSEVILAKAQVYSPGSVPGGTNMEALMLARFTSKYAVVSRKNPCAILVGIVVGAGLGNSEGEAEGDLEGTVEGNPDGLALGASLKQKD